MMGLNEAKHLGNNIRSIRLLKGIKQEVLAAKLCVTQQSISKMEKNKNVSDTKIKQLTEIFEMTMDNIKNFEEEKAIQNNFALRDNVINPVKEIIAYFKDELTKRDSEIESLKAELEALKNNSTETDDNVKNISRKAK